MKVSTEEHVIEEQARLTASVALEWQRECAIPHALYMKRSGKWLLHRNVVPFIALIDFETMSHNLYLVWHDFKFILHLGMSRIT